MQTVRDTGEIQVWTLADGLLAGSLNLGVEPTAMASSPVAPFIIVGTVSGFLLFVDLSDPEHGRIVHRSRAYNSSVSRIV